MQFKNVTLDRLPEIVEVNYKIFEGMYESAPYDWLCIRKDLRTLLL